jgi:ribosomal protein L29
MKAVATAGDELGADIRGKSDSKQPQPNSDDDLKTAKALIEQVQQIAQESNQSEVLSHLKKAIAEINTALAIK